MTMDRLRNLGFLLAFLVFGVVLFSLYGAFRGAIEGGNWVAFLGGILLDRFLFVAAGQIAPQTAGAGTISYPYAAYAPTPVELAILVGAGARPDRHRHLPRDSGRPR